ncbi:MAG: MarR family transcriptional regulator [Sphingopyxis sp.]|uniref:MarR family winged helix-turn-helix transcriptional regulator n=1 Tax=Sphingopyxis sp. TaxID=1908224 RepID=UPI001A2339BD|nr:MarR family transcriptional regulator [Sphingopyxis sp.]MBJ7499439.1 MarR family transcriptional regulator [Sphingopyxis sp.]
MTSNSTDIDYAALAEFRFALRRFQVFSENKAAEAGVTAQQHQALLAIRAAAPDHASVGYVAQRLIVKPHSASELVDRLEAQGLVRREPMQSDRRRALLRLTPQALEILSGLSAAHREEIRRLQPLLVEHLTRLT